MGYPSSKVLCKTLNSFEITCKGHMNSVCTACCYDEMHKDPFSLFDSKFCKPLKLVHLDLWNPAPILFFSGVSILHRLSTL